MGPRFSLLESMALYSNLKRHTNKSCMWFRPLMTRHFWHTDLSNAGLLMTFNTLWVFKRRVKLVLRRPAFKSGHGKQSHHGHEDVVEVKITVEPHPSVDRWLVHISILIQDEGAPVRTWQIAHRIKFNVEWKMWRNKRSDTYLHSTGLDLASSVQR